MKLKTDFRPILADPLHGVRIVLYIVVLAAVFVPLQKELLRAAGWGRSFDGGNPVFSLAQPAILAGGIEVQEGIHHFNGKSGRGVWSGQTTSVLIALVLTYILGPALFAWGLHARAQWRRNPLGNAGVTRIALALSFGGMSLVSIIPAPMYAVISNTTYGTMVHDCRVSAVQDKISEDLFQMARRAQVIYFLPGKMGGGNQSWLAPDRSGNPVIDISRIVLPTQSAECDSLCGSGCETVYSLSIERADSLTIRGVRTETDVQPADSVARAEHTGKIEMCVGVTPDRVNLLLIN